MNEKQATGLTLLISCLVTAGILCFGPPYILHYMRKSIDQELRARPLPPRYPYDVRVTSDRPFVVLPYDFTNPPLRVLYPDSPSWK